MFLEPYLLTGPLRIILFFVFILLIHRIISTRVSAQTALNFLVPTITLVMAAVLIGSFVLVLTNTFDLFVIISVVIGLVIIGFMNLSFKQPIRTQLRKIYTRSILYATIKLERRERFFDMDNIIKPKNKSREQTLTRYHKNWQLAVGFLLPVITYLSRNSLFNQDIYTLSVGWFDRLELINGISLNNWFLRPGEMMGDYLLINLYAQLTDITNAQALQSFSFLQSALLSLVLYWVVFKISRKHAPGILAGLSFALLYTFLPINIELLAQHKSVFTALIIALPTMFFCIYPQSFSFNKKAKFGWLMALFSAILLIDLFVGIFIIFPYLLILLLFKLKNKSRQIMQILLAYLFSVGIIALIYSVVALIKQEDLSTFILSNFYSFDSYTYNPYLIVPFQDLIYYYQIAGLIFLVITIYNYYQRPFKWLASLVFLIFVNILFAVYQWNVIFIDLDILSEVLSVFIPVFFGIILNVLVNLFSVFKFSPRTGTRIEIGVGALVIIALTMITFPSVASFNSEKNRTENMIFEAYSKIQSDNLPYSYAVVNANPYFGFSENSHYYYNYEYFNSTYIDRDRRYNRHLVDSDYSSLHPDLILPEALFVFVYNELEDSRLIKRGVSKEQRDQTVQRIELLELKGRNVDLYFQSNDFKVYQIVNREKATNINELLY